MLFHTRERRKRIFDLWHEYLGKRRGKTKLILQVLLLSPIEFELKTNGVLLFDEKLLFIPISSLWRDERDLLIYIKDHKELMFKKIDVYETYSFFRLYNTRQAITLCMPFRLYLCQRYLQQNMKPSEMLELYEICTDIMTMNIGNKDDQKMVRQYFQFLSNVIKMFFVSLEKPTLQITNK